MSKRIEYYLSDRPSILIRPIELLSPDAQMNLATALLSLAKPKVIGIGQYQRGLLIKMVAHLAKTTPDKIADMNRIEKMRLGSAIAIVASEQIERTFNEVEAEPIENEDYIF